MGSRYIIAYEGEGESLNFGFYNDADFVDTYYQLGGIPGRILLSKTQLPSHLFHYSTTTQLNMETLNTISAIDWMILFM